MSPVELTLGVIGQIELTRQWAKSLKRRYTGMKMVPQLCENIDARLNDATQVMERLNSYTDIQMTRTWKTYLEHLQVCCENGERMQGLDAKVKAFDV